MVLPVLVLDIEATMESEFLTAIKCSDFETASRLLVDDRSLAGKNFLPESLHNDGFPLYHAAELGNLKLVELLLEHGADPNANQHVDEPRERGMPLMNAFHGGHYDVIMLLLDHNPRLDATSYCGTPFVDCLFNATWNHPKFTEQVEALFVNSYHGYFDSCEPVEVKLDQDAPKVVKILQRVVSMGGQPSLFTVVRHQQHGLIERLLKSCSTHAGTPLDWPQGTEFDNICNAASWTGFPQTIRQCQKLCPELYSSDVAKRCIERAIRSHNRDGDIDSYYELIKSQLEFLQARDELNTAYSGGAPFTPFHWLADDFIESSNYGFRCETLSTADDLIRLAKLLVEFGLNLNSVNPVSKLTPWQAAIKENETEYAEYLKDIGGM